MSNSIKKFGTAVLLASIVALGWYTRPVATQAAQLLFASYSGAPKALTATTNGYLNVVLGGGASTVPVIGPYGTASAVGVGIDANTGLYGSAGVLRISCGNVANCAVFTGGAATVAGSFGASSYNLNALTFSAALPTVVSGFGSGLAGTIVTASTATAFRVTVGTNAGGTTGIIGLPTAGNFWNCDLWDMTTPLDVTQQTSATTSQVTFTTTVAWTTGDVLIGRCTGA